MSIYPWDSGSGFGGLEDFLLRKEKRLHALLQRRRYSGSTSTLGLCECNIGERMMLAMYRPVYLTGHCIMKGSMPLLLATSLIKSIYFSLHPPHNASVILTATYTGNRGQGM